MASRGIHEDIGWLDVLVDETSFVQATYRYRYGDCEPQKLPKLERRLHVALERYAARGIEHEQRSPAFAHELDGPREAVAGLVKSLDFAVGTFASAADFLAWSRLRQTSCLIADVNMPSMTGVELYVVSCRRVTAFRPY